VARGGKGKIPLSSTISRAALYALVWSKPLNAIAADFGISGNGLAKICDRLLIPHPPRGYWAGRTARSDLPPLPPAPSGLAEADIVISPRQRAQSRRPRTRLDPEQRREEMIATAAVVLRAEGLNSLSVKRVAMDIGVSEALVNRYFPTLKDLLITLARRETAEMNAAIEYELSRHTTYVDRANATSEGYLNYVAQHGGLLQILLGSPDVRTALRPEYVSRRDWSARNTASNLAKDRQIDLSSASVASQMLRAVTIRMGKLVAARKIGLEDAKRLSQAIIQSGRDNLSPAAEGAGHSNDDGR
jgi:AcrR family transcriptional regulator